VPLARGAIVPAGERDALWFRGSFRRVKLEGETTAGRAGVFEGVLPRGAHGAPPPPASG